MAVGILAAGVVGFGGGWLADNLTESGVLPSGSGLTIQKVINTASGATESEGDAMTTEQIAEKTANSIVEITTEVVKPEALRSSILNPARAAASSFRKRLYRYE